MSGKWYVSLAILVPTIGQKSNLSQTREITDSQSNNNYN